MTISLVAKLKHTGVYSAGVFLQNATFRLNSCVYVLDYPPPQVRFKEKCKRNWKLRTF